MRILADPTPSVRTTSRPDHGSWQEALSDAVRDVRELCRLLQLPENLAVTAEAGARSFPLFAPRPYVARMRPGDPRDPLLRQVLPLADEVRPMPDFTDDPVQEAAAAIAPGLLQKYEGRVLLVTTPACAVHCRYCFRRHFSYAETTPVGRLGERAVAAVAGNDTIEEVIFSGGDPLTLRDEVLSDLTKRIAGVGHVRRLRVHTRLPIMIPQRVTDELIAWLTETRVPTMVVVHANHPQEIDDDVEAGFARLIDAGIVVLNQSVLLKGVNDHAETLAELCRRLVDLRVMPYYLHQLDRVAGAAHFEVPIETGRRLIRELRGRLPGYAVPRYVQEVPGELSKRVLE
jgi:EF-P beta-lysylation protein EpmB